MRGTVIVIKYSLSGPSHPTWRLNPWAVFPMSAVLHRNSLVPQILGVGIGDGTAVGSGDGTGVGTLVGTGVGMKAVCGGKVSTRVRGGGEQERWGPSTHSAMTSAT